MQKWRSYREKRIRYSDHQQHPGIYRVRSERVLGIGCSAYRQQGLLLVWELLVPLSASDFAEMGSAFKISGAERHQRRRENVQDIRACHALSRGYSHERGL